MDDNDMGDHLYADLHGNRCHSRHSIDRGLVMARKKTKADRILEEHGIEILQSGEVGRGSGVPVVGELSSKTTPADFREFERIARLRRVNKDN